MLLSLRFRQAGCVVMLGLLFGPPIPLQASIAIRVVPGIHPQFGAGGFAAGKILQEFHLPSSPNDLFQFLLQYTLKQKLGNTLPLNLNANDAYPTVENGQLPGGSFHGRPLTPSAKDLRTALLPGDYVVPVMAYCTQYSVHRPGQGTAYKLAPVKGTQAEAISTLLWRGTLAGKSPQELQATNWAIQAGVTYDSLPKPYQGLIDQLIPEYRNGLRGNMLDVIQSTYKEVTTDPRKALQTYIKQTYNKTVPVMLLPKIAIPAPPLETVLAKMGPPGELLLDAKKQSNIMLTSYTTKERGEQVLFEGQGERLPPEPAGEGPWTVRIPGQVYMRFVVKSGNMRGDNLMQIRVLAGNAIAATPSVPHFTLASYEPSATSTATDAVAPTSVGGLLGVTSMGNNGQESSAKTLAASGVIGYVVGGSGAQALVPVVAPSAGGARLLFAGKDITGSTQPVVIGQSITLSVELDASAKPASDSPWLVKGNVVGGYSQSKQAAAVLPLRQTTQTIHFYWIEPGTDLEVNYSYIDKDGQASIAKASFDVAAPHGGVQATMNAVQLTYNPGGPRYNNQQSGEWLMLGNTPPNIPIVDVLAVKRGIKITPSITEEAGPGTYFWLQFVTSDTKTQGSKVQKRTCYLDYFNNRDATFMDSPGDALSTPRTPMQQVKGYTVQRDFKARTYLTWQPSIADSIPVSIGSLDWGYHGAAVYSGGSSDKGWELDPSSQASNQAFAQHYLLPEWSPIRCPQ